MVELLGTPMAELSEACYAAYSALKIEYPALPSPSSLEELS
jgi:hypothetical protein